MAVLASVCAVVVGGVAITLFLVLGQDAPRSSSSASPSASATGPRCRGAACEGRNPMDMKCGVGPQTLASYRTASGAMLELRDSRTCGTSWARMWGTRIGDRLEVTADGRPRSAEVETEADAAAYVYTPMTTTRSGTVVRACFRPAPGGESDGKGSASRAASAERPVACPDIRLSGRMASWPVSGGMPARR